MTSLIPRSHTGRMLLVPSDPYATGATDAWRETLIAGGLLGPTIAVKPRRAPLRAFALGERFFEFIAFTGCAVRIESTPGASDTFCHLIIDGPTPEPRFFHGRATRPPKCPGCQRPAPDWQRAASAWRVPADAALRCQHCDGCWPAWQWNWRRSAGFARWALRIEEVFPGEATPLPALFRLLSSATGHSWRWFTVQDATGQALDSGYPDEARED